MAQGMALMLKPWHWSLQDKTFKLINKTKSIKGSILVNYLSLLANLSRSTSLRVKQGLWTYRANALCFICYSWLSYLSWCIFLLIAFANFSFSLWISRVLFLYLVSFSSLNNSKLLKFGNSSYFSFHFTIWPISPIHYHLP